MERQPPRVVSLLPSATEMVCAVGMGDALVGVSHECDWPPEVVGLPVLTSSKVPILGTSGSIDHDVRQILRSALAVYDIDVARLEEVRPDVIVTQDLCDVCAVSLADVEEATRSLTSDDVRIVNLHPTRLGDIWSDLLRVGGALECEVKAQSLRAEIEQRIDGVRARAASAGQRPRVLTIEWIDPVMVGGMWMPELVEIAGGEPLVTRAGEHAPTLTMADLEGLDPAPEVVLVKPCGYKIERSLARTIHEHARQNPQTAGSAGLSAPAGTLETPASSTTSRGRLRGRRLQSAGRNRVGA